MRATLSTLALSVAAFWPLVGLAQPSATPVTATASVGGDEGSPRDDAIAMFGKPALPPGFKNFPYVNADAPKGGEVVLGALGSFDSFNPFVLRGTAAAEAGQVYESLLKSSADEARVGYAHVAKTVEIAEDHRSVAFTIRPEAKFEDGTSITAEDVAWSFTTLRDKGRPNFRQLYADVAGVDTDGPSRVVFRFKTAENRALPLVIGQLPIMAKHWWEKRDFTAPLTEPPMGSGPYHVERFEMGRTTVMARRSDYWGANLPTMRGLANFERVRTEYYRDATVMLEAFKSGRIDFRQENIAKNWATAYDFPAVQNGLVRKQSFRHHLPTGMQSYVMNIRKPVFADRRVREALVQVFDFEWLNKNLFFGQYVRTKSYYSNSDYEATGLPQGDELALLSEYKDKLPPELFTKPYTLPVTDGSGNNRDGLKRALALFEQAGWKIQDRRMVDGSGNQMSFEILSDDPTIERVATPYVQWLAHLGIAARVRTVDAAQWQHLTDTFDFDMTMMVLPEPEYPGNEQRDYFTCASGKEQGSDNEAGICDPVVDALVDRVIGAKDKATLVTATRALDRVLVWGWYAVPNWHTQTINAAFWNRFGFPSQPVRTGVVFDSWWVDQKLAAVTDVARSGH